jgi:CubicO group peptidase (beta-lactamase class C family)
MHRTLRALPFALVTSFAIYPASAQRAAAPAGWTAFTRMFDSAVVHDSIVGSAIVLVKNGAIIAHHEHGWADRANKKPVTERTLFHYGSITKTLTAISIMQLRDRGKLSLDDRVTSYIPELRLVHDPYGSMDSVTIRMLLSHSAGFQNPTWPYGSDQPWEPFEPTTWNQLVAMMPYQQLLFKPGSQFSYSNPGFIYLARIIEQLAGDPWETYVQKNILSPLALTRSSFGATPYYLAADRSHNYSVLRDSSGRTVVRDNGADFDPGITIPNGGWNAPLTDLATYIGYLTNAARGDSTTRRLYDVVLPRASLEEMWKPRFPTSADSTEQREWMGMSFFVLHRGGRTIIGHTGSQAGFLAFLYFDPATGAGVVAAFNTASEAAGGPKPDAFRAIREAALALLQ